MNASDLKYPILCRTKYGLSCMSGPDRLTTAFVRNLRSGYYSSLKIIDSEGVTYMVTKVEQSGWVGPFLGFSLLYSRRAKIAIELVRAEEQMSVDEVRRVILEDMERSPEWSARGDTDVLKTSVATNQSVRGLIETICS